MRIWAVRVFIKSENFKLFGGVLVVYFTNGYLRFGFLEPLYGFFLLHELIPKCFLCIWLVLTYVNVGMCLLHVKCLVNCLYEFKDRISWLVLWWLLYEVIGCIHSCYHVLKHVTLRLIMSESFWHSIKIIVILFWNCKFVPDKFESAAIHDI